MTSIKDKIQQPRSEIVRVEANTKPDVGNAIGFRATESSLHDIVQAVAAKSLSTELQSQQTSFNAAVLAMYNAFPRRDNGIAIEHHVDTCARLMPDVLFLVQYYQDWEEDEHNPLVPTEEFIALLKSSIWYLYETGDDTTALELLTTVYAIIPQTHISKTTEFYADLQYTAGSIYLNWSFLPKCRSVWTEARTILEVYQAAGSLSAKRQLTWLYMALGNLETADGNFEAAMVWFERSDKGRVKEDAGNKWREGLSRMNVGRLCYFMGEYGRASRFCKEAEKAFLRSDASWVACIKYIRANIAMARMTWLNNVVARRNYLQAVKALRFSGSNQIMLAACFTKLARLELQDGNLKLAEEYIRDAQRIAWSHAHSQGDQARNLHTLSEIQTAQGLTIAAENSKRRAEDLKKELWESLGMEVNKGFDGSDKAWDGLVCFFWR